MFCEECGAQLEAGARFCENCGAQIDQAASGAGSAPEPVAEPVAVPAKKAGGGAESGVIVTRLSALAEQLNCSSQELSDKIAEYVAFKKERGVDYSLIDLQNSGPSVDSVISALKEKLEANPFKYVFILGNEEIINVAKWENKSEDSDPLVPSDFAYTSLSSSSPWDGVDMGIDKMLCVGRLPSYAGESLSKFASYFENAMKADGAFSSLKYYGLSAKVWGNESAYEFKKFSSRAVDVSPNVTCEDVGQRINGDENILFFNLHGSDETKYWYGQEDSSYPEAFAPENLDAVKTPFFLGVEACYGARYAGNLDESQSVIVKAMQSGCLAALGSSMIAYGTPEPNGSCADFIIGEYLKEICLGSSAGDAHLAGIDRLFSESDDFSDTETKTLAEFSLYGDPSASTGKSSAGASLKTAFSSPLISASLASFAKKKAAGRYVSLPDIRAAVQMNLAQVDEKIAQMINKHVYSFYKELEGVEAKTFRFSSKDLWQSIYQKKINAINKTVKVYYDSAGRIKKELESK